MRPSRTPRWRPAKTAVPTAWAAVAGVAVIATVLAGCTPGDPSAEPEATSASPQSPGDGGEGAPSGTGAPEGFESYYEQQIDWSGCEGGFECATVAVPISWDEPESGSMDLELKQLPASGDREGSLLVNPGGPGASGIEFVEGAEGRFGEPVLDAYDVVGFDPRGVGASSPIVCFDDARKDESLSKDFPETEAGLEGAQAELRAWGEACAENTGPQLATVDTQSAARDMDMLRSALGEDELDYLGFSYGTKLGATYAGLFPERVGRLVLDGALDPTTSSADVSAQQAVGFENALRAYVEDCQSGECPLTGSVDDGMQQIRTLLDEALDRPFPTDSDRDLTQTLMFYGIALPLYSQGNWPLLTQALDEITTTGEGTTFLYLADFYNDRNPDGTFANNSAEAFRAINCLDDSGNPDMAFMDAQAEEIEAAAPTVGEFFTYDGLTCADWPVPEVEQDFDASAAGAPPILVVGTTNDPATPYAWAESLAGTLDSGTLLTYEGEGHTAYGSSNDCVSGAVDAFLVDGTVPEVGTTC
nr:alpha/beta hydrolase [Paraoerskovia sediminicola]